MKPSAERHGRLGRESARGDLPPCFGLRKLRRFIRRREFGRVSFAAERVRWERFAAEPLGNEENRHERMAHE